MRFFILIFLLNCTSVFGQRERAEAYINKYKDLAISEMQRTGIPASITLAQGILESQFGESDLAKNANNHFGIKCKTEWTGPKTYHDDDLKKECFRVYATAEESYKDHSNFLMTREWYAFLFKLAPTDDSGWAYGLKKAGYATERDYPQRLLKLINDYQLQQYNLVGADKAIPVNIINPVSKNQKGKHRIINKNEINSNKNSNTTDTVAVFSKKSIEATDTEELTVVENPEKKIVQPELIEKKTNYPNTVFTINHSRVIFAEAGTALLSIANQYDISLGKLVEFNELNEKDILQNDQLIFLERKLKKGSTDNHIVLAGETLTSISQKEGVRLESLMEYNRLKKDAQLHEGEKINLRAATPQVSTNFAIKQPK